MKVYFTQILTIFYLFLAISLPAQVNFPKPDSTFNGTGYNLIEDYPDFEPNHIAMQADGKILAAGYGNITIAHGNFDGLLARINQDGTLDTGFGAGGVKVLDIDGNQDRVSGLHLLPDGKILVLLESFYRSFLIQLNPDGSYDTSFGNAGILSIPTNNSEQANALLIQGDNKILILSDYVLSNKYVVTVRRCNTDGTLDASYGDNGRVTLENLPQFFYAPFGALQADGKLVLSGTYGYLNSSGYLVVRLNTDGTLDNSFSGDGIFLKTLGNVANPAVPESIALKSDGTIYLGGAAPGSTDVSLTILSLTANGTTTPGFGFGGLAQVSFGTYATAKSLVLQPDGKIIAAGFKYIDQTSSNFMLARLNTNGTLDPTFGNAGKVLLSPFASDYNLEIFAQSALAPNGSLVCLGWVRETHNFADSSEVHFSAHRFLTGITVKAEEPSALFQDSKAIPNLLSAQASINLEYTLTKSSSVNASLFDETGNWIKTLIPNTMHGEGRQNEVCTLPQDLPAGIYYIVLDSGKEVKPIRMVKM